MKIKALEASEISDFGSVIPKWEVTGCENLKRSFTFSDFKNALEFVNIIGDLSETLNHHPDIFLTWGKVSITLSTHSVKGISELDIELARRIDTSFGKFSELKA